jgi:hypothetical protein
VDKTIAISTRTVVATNHASDPELGGPFAFIRALTRPCGRGPDRTWGLGAAIGTCALGTGAQEQQHISTKSHHSTIYLPIESAL